MSKLQDLGIIHKLERFNKLKGVHGSIKGKKGGISFDLHKLQDLSLKSAWKNAHFDISGKIGGVSAEVSKLQELPLILPNVEDLNTETVPYLQELPLVLPNVVPEMTFSSVDGVVPY